MLLKEVVVLFVVVSDYNFGIINFVIFEGVVEKVFFGYYYVYWCDSEYRYCFVVGFLIVFGIMFSLVEFVMVYIYECYYIFGDLYYIWSVFLDVFFMFLCGFCFVYFDIGGYFVIFGREVNKYDVIMVYCVIGVVLFVLFDCLCCFCFSC